MYTLVKLQRIRRAIRMTGLKTHVYGLGSSQFDFTEGITGQCLEAKALLQRNKLSFLLVYHPLYERFRVLN